MRFICKKVNRIVHSGSLKTLKITCKSVDELERAINQVDAYFCKIQWTSRAQCPKDLFSIRSRPFNVRDYEIIIFIYIKTIDFSKPHTNRTASVALPSLTVY